jgi:DNA-directed RNA polymerase II subunit RPB7
MNILQLIEKNSHVRMKIVGTRVDATEIVSPLITISSLPLVIYYISCQFAIGTIKEDHLGVID